MEKEGARPEADYPFRDPALSAGRRAEDLISRLSLEEKVKMMASRQAAVPRLGIPEFHIGGEAAHGYVSTEGPSTSFPQTIGLACSWDADLLRRIGARVSDEARAYYHRRRRLGGICLFAPTVDMERDPRWGRTEEGYGEDPRLAGKLSAAYVRGLQGDDPLRLKAAATPKHFYANNNEALRASCSASIPPRLRREYYLAAFRPAIEEAGAASLMTSYNAINGLPSMLHPDLSAVAKGEWGMEGFAVCDGGALPLLASAHKRFPGLEEAIAASVKACIDNFSDDSEIVVKALEGALARGLLAEADLDKALARSLAVRFRLGAFDPPELDPYSAIGESVLWSADARELALEAARKSIVLLANRGDGRGLPLAPSSIRSLAVLGPLADVAYRDWYTGKSRYRVTPFQALCAALPSAELRLVEGSDLVSFRAPGGKWVATKAWYDHDLAAHRAAEAGGESFRRCDWGWGSQTFRSLASGYYLSTDDAKVKCSSEEVWGWYVRERFSLEKADLPGETGALRLRTWKGDPVRMDAAGALIVEPAAEGGAGDPLVMETIQDGTEEAAEAARACDAAILFLGNHPLLNGKEEIDRPSLALPPAQERLAAATVAANPRTVVVIVGSYPYALGPWRERAAAILYAPHGGQEAGTALAEAILGASNPAGRCPMTWYPDEGALGDIMDYDIVRKGTTYLHYRGEPLYPFGHGLSYSRFEYLGLELSGDSILREGSLRVKVKLRNASAVDGEEVVQLYASFPGSEIQRPIRALVDFARLKVPAGACAETELLLRARDLEAWDQGEGRWFLERGAVRLEAGASSADIRLSRDLVAQGEAAPRRDPSAWIGADAFDDCEGLILTEGDGFSSCLAPRRADPESRGVLRFDRADFKQGGKARFEALFSASSAGSLELLLNGEKAGSLRIGKEEGGADSPGSPWKLSSTSLTLPPGEQRIEIGTSGSLSILKFRFLPE